MEKEDRGTSDSYFHCRACGNLLIGDFDKGEVFCPSCGFVALDLVEDLGPEWKAIDPDDKSRRVRVGSPRTLAMHDFGLTTEIGPIAHDPYGKSLKPFMKISIEKMRKWQTRIRTSSSGERGLSNVLSKIKTSC